MPSFDSTSILAALRAAASSGSMPLQDSNHELFWEINEAPSEATIGGDQYDRMSRHQLIQACRAKDRLLSGAHDRLRRPIPDNSRDIQVELRELLDMSGRSEGGAQIDVHGTAAKNRRDRLWRRLQPHLERDWVGVRMWMTRSDEDSAGYYTVTDTLQKVIEVIDHQAAIPANSSFDVTSDESLKVELKRLSRSILPLYAPGSSSSGGASSNRTSSSFAITTLRSAIEKAIPTGRLDPVIIHPLLSTAVTFSPRPILSKRTPIISPLLRLPRLPPVDRSVHVRPGGEDVLRAVDILTESRVKLDGRSTYLVSGVIVIGEGDGTSIISFSIHPCVKVAVIYGCGEGLDGEENSELCSKLLKDIIEHPSLKAERPAQWRYELTKVFEGSHQPSYSDMLALEIVISSCTEETCIARPYDFNFDAPDDTEVVDIEQVSFASTWGCIERAMLWAEAALGTIREGTELAPGI